MILKRIGFIGLGTMGRPMCTNLLKAGFAVSVFARRQEQAEPLIQSGARWAASPAELAKDVDVVITIVGDSADVASVVLREDGVLAGSHAGQVLIDMTSISPETTRMLAQRAADVGVDMLDAPVTGGDVGARNATLTIMVGGKLDVLDRCRPILAQLGQRIVWAGPSGNGQTLKLVNQVICGLHLLALGEGLGLAEACGLDLSTVLEVVTGGAAGSWALSNLGPRIVQGNFDPGFSIAWQQKDLRNAQAQAESTRFPLPGTALAQQMLRAAEALGLSQAGTHAIIQAYRALGARN